MSAIGRIQISQQPLKLEMRSQRVQMEMQQPKADLQIQQQGVIQEIRQPRGEMEIDQSRAWDALGQGNNLKVMKRVYAQSFQLGQEAIAAIVERGNRMAALHLKQNVIADLAREGGAMRFPRIQYTGEAAYDNVDIHYTPRAAEISHTVQPPRISAAARYPQVNWQPSTLDVQVSQWHSVQITPPAIDWSI